MMYIQVKKVTINNISVDPDFIEKYEISGIHSESSKLILTESKTGPKHANASLGVAASSVLMGDTSMFTPQSVMLPKIKVKNYQNNSFR